MHASITSVDLKSLHADISAELNAAFQRVVASGRYVLGPEVESFEQAFAQYCEADFCVGVASGLDALKLALMALDIGNDDEVIVPSHAYQATWLAVISVGAKPVPVEPAGDGYLIDPGGIAQAITKRTRAIMPIHLYGEPCDMSSICTIASEAGLAIIEDAAQAHGAKWKGMPLGTHGDAVCWSFYPTKNLGALGDGGAVTTNNRDVAKKIRTLRNYGVDSERNLEEKGLNSRLDELQAALLSVKLAYLDRWNNAKRRIAGQYDKRLAGSKVKLPSPADDSLHAWHQYVVQLECRNEARRKLADRGISTEIHYPVPVANQSLFQRRDYRLEPLPKAIALSQRILSLPIHPGLSEAEVLTIAQVLRSVTA